MWFWKVPIPISTGDTNMMMLSEKGQPGSVTGGKGSRAAGRTWQENIRDRLPPALGSWTPIQSF